MSKESLVFSEVFRELDHLVVSIMIPPLSLHSFLFFSKFGYKCGIERVELNMCVGSIPAQFDAGANKSDVGNRMWETCILTVRFSSLSLSTLQFFLQPSSAQLSILVASYIRCLAESLGETSAKMAKSDPVGSFQIIT